MNLSPLSSLFLGPVMAPAASPSPETISLLQPPAPASPPLHDYTGAPPSLSAPLGVPAHSSPPFLSTPTSSPASPSQVSSPLATPISAPPQPVKSPLPLPPPLANAIPPEVVSFFPLPPALKSPLLPPSSLVVTFPSPPPLPSPPKFPSPPVPLASSTSPPPSPLPIVPPPYLPSPSPQPSSPNSSPKTPWVRPYKIVPLQFANKSLHKIEHSHLLTGLVVGCFLGGVILLLLFGLLYVIRYKFRRTKNPNRLQKDYCKPHCLPPNGAHVITLLPKPLVSPPPPPAISSLESYGSSGSGSVDMKVAQPRKRMLHFSCGTFTYEELEAATNGFSEASLLGQGGFGYVHKGVLRTGKEVAVKKLKNGSLQGEREFQAEVETVSRIHHKHLVSLVGYCLTGAERLVVYEFVNNNTLEFHLHGTGQPIMEWETRLRIAIGSAKGLAYLHEDCHPAIIHRDIKASNILLDSQFEAKVSDFGFAKYLLDNNTHISTRVVGTFGYLAPEYASSGKLTDKSDVYSYGIMLLELITGRPPINKEESSMSESLVDWARPLLNKALEDGNFHALVDPKLKNNYNCKEMTGMVACAAACVRHSAWLRPRMSQVVCALEGDVSLTKLDDQSGDDTTLSISSTDELSISSIDEQKYH